MQQESIKADYDNQGSLHTTYGSEDTYQPHPEPPRSKQYAPQSGNSIGYATSSTQYDSQTELYRPPSILFVPMHKLLKQTRLLTFLTPKLRAFFLISGIMYLIWGGLAIGLEAVLLMYSYSTYYRGIWVGGVMIGAGVNMLIIACREYHSMAHVIRLFVLVFIFCAAGVGLGTIDIATTRPCNHSTIKYICDKKISYTLKIIILTELGLAAIHTGVNLFVIKCIKNKPVTTPSASNGTSYQHSA